MKELDILPTNFRLVPFCMKLQDIIFDASSFLDASLASENYSSLKLLSAALPSFAISSNLLRKSSIYRADQLADIFVVRFVDIVDLEIDYDVFVIRLCFLFETVVVGFSSGGVKLLGNIGFILVAT